MPRPTLVTFSLPFVKGWARPRLGRGGAYSPGQNREIAGAVAAAYRQACMDRYGELRYAPEGTEVTLRVRCYKRMPKRTPKRVRSVPFVVKPDADNVLKGVMDGLTGVAYRDDAQVTDIKVEKCVRTEDVKESTYVDVAFGSLAG